MADESLTNLWNRFTLTSDEQANLTVAPALIQQPTQHRQLCLVGRLIIHKLVAVGNLRDYAHRVW